MAINFNTGPYFDDFDPQNNFYRVLFKPGYAIQARELNQLQSILQNQVSSVGKHLFKKNAIVIPGGMVLNKAADIVRVVGVDDPTTLIGKTITNYNYSDYTNDSEFDANNAITAVVLAAKIISDDGTTTTSALYVKYFKTGLNGAKTFGNNVALYTVESSQITFASYNGTTTDAASTVGKVATIKRGVFFTKDIFVDVETQHLIVELDKKTVSNCTIGLDINESIVTAKDDETLLDNSNGYPNQYAPGADRYKIELTLSKKVLLTNPNNRFDENKFIKMMEIENNSIIYVNNKTEYAELMKMLAQRTYDANGNFIVNGLDTSLADFPENDSYVDLNMTPGKCYVGGYEYDRVATTKIPLEKPRSSAYQESVSSTKQTISDVPYMYIAGATGLRAMPQPHSVVQFLNATPDASNVSNIGHGVFRDAYYAFGGSTTPIYIFRFDSINLYSGKTLKDIGGIRPINSASNYGVSVLQELTISNINGNFAAGNGISNANTSTTRSALNGATGVIYYVAQPVSNAQKIYVRKTTTQDVPSANTVKSSAGGVATCTANFISNYTANYLPVVKIASDIIRSVDTLNTNTIVQQTIASINSGTNNFTTLTSPSQYSTISSGNYFGFVDGQFVDLSTSDWSLTLSGDNRQVSFTPTNGATGFIGKSMSVYATVATASTPSASTRTNKAQQTVTQFVVPVSNKAWTVLGHQDVTKIDKIVEGKCVAVTEATWSSGTVTITCASPHGLAPGDIVVVRDIVSSGSTGVLVSGGIPTNDFTNLSSYNGQFTVSTVVGGVSAGATGFTYTITTGDPGTSNTANGIVALPPNINTDTAVTSRYDLYNGWSYNFVGNGMIRFKDNKTNVLPKGQLGVKYYYLALDSSATRNYIDAASYNNAYVYAGATGINAISKIPNATNNTGNRFNPRSSLDYRTRTSNGFVINTLNTFSNTNRSLAFDLNVSGATGLIGQYIVANGYPNGVQIKQIITGFSDGTTVFVTGATGVAISTAPAFIGVDSNFKIASTGQTFDLPKDTVTYTYTKFKPRDVIVYLDRKQDQLTIKQEEVTNQNIASRPDDPGFALGMSSRDPFKLPLVRVHMPPYTLDSTGVTLTKFENPVYQMIDIHNLKKRIDKNEVTANLALSTATTALAAALAPRDSWVENFNDPDNRDSESKDFACTVYENNYAAPAVTSQSIDLELAKDPSTNAYYDSTTFTQISTTLTLPYTESRAFRNVNASTFNNLNPFNTTQWEGKLKLVPHVDNLLQDSTATEIITSITNWYNDRGSAGGGCDKWHRFSFNWKTNTGRTGKVDIDIHVVEKRFSAFWAKYPNCEWARREYAEALINKNYDDPIVKEFLNLGDYYNGRNREAVGNAELWYNKGLWGSH